MYYRIKFKPNSRHNAVLVRNQPAMVSKGFRKILLISLWVALGGLLVKQRGRWQRLNP